MEKLPAKSVREQLSQWESKLAPLSDSQKVVVMELSGVASQRPLREGVSIFQFPVQQNGRLSLKITRISRNSYYISSIIVSYVSFRIVRGFHKT